MQALIVPQTGEATIFKRLLMAKGERTRTAYAGDLLDFALFLGLEPQVDQHPLVNVPDTAWRSLDVSVIAAYLEYLKTTVSAKTGRLYSTATIARRMSAVREFLTEACFQGYFERAKLDYIRERVNPPAVTHEHHAGISPDDQIKLLRAANAQPGLKGLRDYALLRLWMDTGLRRAEMAGLKVRDLTTKEGIPTLKVRGKGRRIREVGLEGYTAFVVRDWLEQSDQVEDPKRPIFCQVRKEGRGDRAVYKVIEPDRHLTGMALWSLIKWYADQAELESAITAHSFRVAMVTDMLDGGAPLQHVQAAGGWTSTRMITEVYDRNAYREPVSRYRKTALPRREVATQETL